MLCAVDDAILLASGFGGVTSHRCPHCLGIYVPENWPMIDTMLRCLVRPMYR